MDLNEPWFSLVRDGHKTIEGRIYDDKRRRLNVDEQIEFTNKENNKKSFTKIIKRLEIWDNRNSEKKIEFKDVINEDNFKKLIPTAKNKEEAIQVYNNIPKYNEKSIKDGIIFIYLE